MMDSELLLHQQNRNHVNVVTIVEFCEWVEGNSTWIIMEFCHYGSLNDFCRNHPHRFNNNRVKLDLMLQIAAGIQFLHEAKLIHRDIKPSNILLAEEEGQIVVKITNFGVCREDMENNTKTVVGTKAFLSPEFWPFEDIMQKTFNEKVDIFALGLTFLAIIQGQCDIHGLMPRLEGLKKSQLALTIGHLMYIRKEDGDQPLSIITEKADDDDFTKLVKSIVIEATHVEPQQRITAEYIYQRLTAFAVKQVGIIFSLCL